MFPRKSFILFLTVMAKTFVGGDSAQCAFQSNEAGLLRRSLPRRCSVETDGCLRDEVLQKVLLDAKLIPASWAMDRLEINSLSNGFCNRVYKVKLPAEDGVVVVKVYSPMAKVRLQADFLGLGDIVASDIGVSPKLVYRGEDGLVMQFIDGAVLNDFDISGNETSGRFGDGKLLCESVAKRVAQLHKDQLPSGGEVISNMNWHSIQNMLSYVGCDEAISPSVRAKGWTYDCLCREFQEMRETVDALELPVVLGHNDLKPANVMTRGGSGTNANAFDVVLIDLELTGYAPRGYDICKLFRTSENTAAAIRNRKAFARAYLMAITDQNDVSNDAVDTLLLEADLFEPLTWLEAGIFFLFAAKGDPTQIKIWEVLATDRLQQYMLSKEQFRANISKWCNGRNVLPKSRL